MFQDTFVSLHLKQQGLQSVRVLRQMRMIKFSIKLELCKAHSLNTECREALQ